MVQHQRNLLIFCMHAILRLLLNEFQHLVHHQQEELFGFDYLPNLAFERLHVLQVCLGLQLVLKLIVTNFHAHRFEQVRHFSRVETRSELLFFQPVHQVLYHNFYLSEYVVFEAENFQVCALDVLRSFDCYVSTLLHHFALGSYLKPVHQPS